MSSQKSLTRVALTLSVALLAAPAPAVADVPARIMYANAMAQEKAMRAAWDGDGTGVVKQAHAVVAAYEAVVRQHPASAYCDNALWQAAMLARDLFAKTHQESDRQKSATLFAWLAREYPSSSLASKATAEAHRLQDTSTNRTATASAVRADRPSSAPQELPKKLPADTRVDAPAATVLDIKRIVLPEIVRVSIEVDREVTYHEERIENPPRLMIDLPSARVITALQEADLTYQDDVVRHITVGQHPNQATSVGLDLAGVGRYTVVTLSSPFRILIDCERLARPSDDTASLPRMTATPVPDDLRSGKAPDAAKGAETSTPPAAGNLPLTPPAEKSRLSMARQLGLGISRVVIDPGHGGYDPGAEAGHLAESRVVLDIALRLEKLLAKEGIEVVLTRRTDVFVPLEERTAIANREQADLFLSIHANASHNPRAQGIETYYLNLASNADAEAVAVRENAASGRTMNSLPDMLKMIALNTKLDESKDLARLVQQAMTRHLGTSNMGVRDLGVKQAPFVVLIGAAMPSVLAEVSFVTNKREGQLLGSEIYRQRIAEALSDAIVRYRRTLKNADVASRQ